MLCKEMQKLICHTKYIYANHAFMRRKEKIVSLETFMDACVIYNALEKNKDNAMVRCEGFNLDIYPNEPRLVTSINDTNRCCTMA